MDKRRKDGPELDKTFLPACRCEPGATVVVRVGIQPGELLAPPSVAETCEELVASESPGEADQDRCQGRPTWTVPHIPDGRGGHQQGVVRRSSVASRSIALMSCLGKSSSPPRPMGECLYLLNITRLFMHSAPVDDRTGPKGSIFEGNGATIESVHRREES